MKIEDVLGRAKFGISDITECIYLFIPAKDDPNNAKHKVDITEKLKIFVKANKESFFNEKTITSSVIN